MTYAELLHWGVFFDPKPTLSAQRQSRFPWLSDSSTLAKLIRIIHSKSSGGQTTIFIRASDTPWADRENFIVHCFLFKSDQILSTSLSFY